MDQSTPFPAHMIVVEATGLRLMLHGGAAVERLVVEMRREEWRPSEDGPPGVQRTPARLEVAFALYSEDDSVPGQYNVLSRGSGWSAGFEVFNLSVFPSGGIPRRSLGCADAEVRLALAEHVNYAALNAPTNNPDGASNHARHLTLVWTGSKFERSADGWIDGPFLAEEP